MSFRNVRNLGIWGAWCASLCVVLSLFPLLLTGCGHAPTPTPPTTNTDPTVPTVPVTPSTTVPDASIAQDIREGAQLAAGLGLMELAKKNPATAASTAAIVHTNATTALTYLSSGKLDTGAVLMQVVNSHLLDNLPPEIKIAVSGASLVLNHFVSPPSADKFMTPVEIAYVTAFIQGIDDAAVNYGTKDALPPSRRGPLVK